MRKSLLAVAVAAAVSFVPVSVLAASPSGERAGAAQRTDDFVSSAEIKSFRADPAHADVLPFTPDFGALSKSNQPMRLQLKPGVVLDVTPISFKRNADGVQIWEGVLTDFAKTGGGKRDVGFDAMNSVTMVNNQGKITGSIRLDGQLFKVRPLASGGHVVIEVNEAQMPPDHPHGVKIPDTAMSRALGNGSLPAPPKANSIIRVMTVATNSAINAAGDIVGLVNLAITEANQSYANSGVQITLQSAGIYSTSYVESGSFNTDLTRFRGTSDGHMDSVHSLRNTNTADVMMLVINNSSSCGLASGIGSTASTAFAAVHWSCATGYYSFGHEIGHLQSARHDPANDPNTSPYAYGHGYQYPSGGWRTVMAYACSGGCTRINYWSNPSVTYGGVPMGTAATHDNERVLNNTRATIAAFR